MSNSFQQISGELKKNILEDYLSGMDVKDIAMKYKFKYSRTVYYHLAPLSRESKLVHLNNSLLKKESEVNNG